MTKPDGGHTREGPSSQDAAAASAPVPPRGISFRGRLECAAAVVAGYGGEIHVADDANGNAKIKIYIPKAESAPVRGARTAPRAAPPAWRGVDDPAARLAELQARARERNRAKRERKRLQKQALQEQVHCDEAERGSPVRPSPLQPARADIGQRSAVSQQQQAAHAAWPRGIATASGMSTVQYTISRQRQRYRSSALWNNGAST